MAHPTLVIVPTSFTNSSMYDGPVNVLLEKGFSVHALDLPSGPANYAPNKPAPSMYDDADFINEFTTKLADKGDDILILAHGYGGGPAAQSLEKLTKHERAANGKKGGIVRIAFMTAVVPKVGESTLTTLAASSKGGAPTVNTDSMGWMTQTYPEQTAKAVFNSLSPEESIKLCKAFGCHAAPAFIQPLTHPGYQDLPVSWYFCEDDLSVVPEVQQNAIDMIEQSWRGNKRQGKMVNVTRNKCDHMPFFSVPGHFNAWVENVLLMGGGE